MSDSESQPQQEMPRPTAFKFVMPILITILLATILSGLTMDFYVTLAEEEGKNISEKPPPPMTPIVGDKDTQAEAGILNTIFYVGLALVGGFIFLWLLRSGLINILQLFIASLMGFSCFLFGTFFFSLMYYQIVNSIHTILPEILVTVLMDSFNLIVFVVSLAYGIIGFSLMGLQRGGGQKARNVIMITFGAGIGSLLGIHFPLVSTILVLIGLSLYDIFAVFRGPIKGILNHGMPETETVDNPPRALDDPPSAPDDPPSALPDDMPKTRETVVTVPLLPILPLYTTETISIGLGDFAFYSMLIGHSVRLSFITNSPFPLLLGFAGTILGVWITFQFLLKRSILPGLPIAIFLGLIGMTLGILLSGASLMDLLTY